MPYTSRQLFRKTLAPPRISLRHGIATKAGTRDGVLSRGPGVDPDNAHYATIGRTPILIYGKLFLSDIYRVVEDKQEVYLVRKDGELLGPFSESTTANDLSEIAYRDLDEYTTPGQQKPL